jgi:hypothetical protein
LFDVPPAWRASGLRAAGKPDAQDARIGSVDLSVQQACHPASFCVNCGIAPYADGEGKAGPMAAVNVRCLPDVDLETPTITKVDGRRF